jgi:hypothetical protein
VSSVHGLIFLDKVHVAAFWLAFPAALAGHPPHGVFAGQQTLLIAAGACATSWHLPPNACTEEPGHVGSLRIYIDTLDFR